MFHHRNNGEDYYRQRAVELTQADESHGFVEVTIKFADTMRLTEQDAKDLLAVLTAWHFGIERAMEVASVSQA